MKSGAAKFKGFAIVRDQYGRIVMDESIFHDKDKLEIFRQEVVRNGNDSSSNSNS